MEVPRLVGRRRVADRRRVEVRLEGAGRRRLEVVDRRRLEEAGRLQEGAERGDVC